jgi:ABC-type sugar transport system substrate-binding protein
MSRKIVASFLSRDLRFQLYEAADAQAAAKREQLELEVLFAESDAIRQIQQLLPFVQAPPAQRPAAIMVETVTGEGLERVAREAAKAGIAWILLNRRVNYSDALRAECPKVPIVCMGVDQAMVGRIHGHQLGLVAPRGGSVLYFEGKADTSAARERLAGTREVLEETRTCSLRVYAGEWTEESGHRAASGWLRPRLNSTDRPVAVVAQNDEMAVGARRAFKELRPEWADVPFIGCDGLPDHGQRLVGNGEFTATVITPSPAGPAVELVSQWLETRILPPREIMLPPQSHPLLEQMAVRPAARSVKAVRAP